jgi:redox-regulated HSP33 family molecular chaperone
MIKENSRSINLEFSCRCSRRQTAGALNSSTTSEWECLPRFPEKRSVRAVSRCRSADYNLFVDQV